MTVGDLPVRIILAAVPVASMLAYEVVEPAVRAFFRQKREKKLAHHRLVLQEARASVAVSTVSAAAEVKREQQRRERIARRKALLAQEKTAPAPVLTQAPSVKAEAGALVPKDTYDLAVQPFVPKGDGGEEVWQAAQALPHRSTPDWVHDEAYLTLLQQAAEKGHPAALDKLGDYAFCQKLPVEAFYWKLKVKLYGGKSLGVQPKDILRQWKRSGYPKHARSFTRIFTEQRALFARTVLKLQGKVDEKDARRQLHELIDEGDPDALLFRRWCDVHCESSHHAHHHSHHHHGHRHESDSDFGSLKI